MRLPSNLTEAVEAFEADTPLRDALGESLSSSIAAVRRVSFLAPAESCKFSTTSMACVDTPWYSVVHAHRPSCNLFSQVTHYVERVSSCRGMVQEQLMIRWCLPVVPDHSLAPPSNTFVGCTIAKFDLVSSCAPSHFQAEIEHYKNMTLEQSVLSLVHRY